MASESNIWSVGRAKAAITAGDLDVLQEWIENAKPTVATVDELMQHCVAEEQDQLFRVLLDAGATPTKFVESGPRSPLFAVLKKNKGDADTLKLILDNVKPTRIKRYVNAKDRKSYTALYVACKNGHAESARILLEKGSKVNSPSGYDGFMPLMGAADKGHLEIVRMLIEYDANVNKSTMLGDTALCCAAKGGHVECMRGLIQAGADVNATTKCGETALMAAAKTKGKDTLGAVKELLTAGADVTVKDWRLQTALWYASNFSTEEVAIFLAERLQEAGACDADLSLLVAVERDHSKLLRYLIDNDWKVNRRDKYGRSLLHIAAERGVTKCLAYILESNNIKHLNINETAGRFFELSPLHLAIRWCHPKAVELFLNAGADPDWCDKHHASPLIACMSTSELRSRATLAKLLLRHGCNVHALVNPKVVQPWGLEELEGTDGRLRTALAWAVCLRELWLAKMLWAAGAKASEVASWTEVTLPWHTKHIYPEEEYTTTASKADVLDFIHNSVCQPRCLAEVCRIQIRDTMTRPVHSSLSCLPLPVNIIEFLNVPEWDILEEENLKEDEGIREKRSLESDDDFDVESSTSGSDDSGD